MFSSAFKKIYFITLVLIIVSLFLLEFLLRVYGLGDPIIYGTNLSYRYFPLPNQSVNRLRGSNIKINDKSLRATLEWDNDNKNKILFFGDSVTYGGSYIDNKEIFSELVCYNLNAKNKKKYLCGNAGVNAYGVDNIKNRILYGEVQNQEWTVVTLFSEDGYRSLQNISAIPAFLNKPKLFPAIQECFLHITWRADILLRNNYFFNASNIQKKENFIYFYEESFKNLNEVLIGNSERGKKILVVFHPSKQEVLSGKQSEEYLLMKNVFQRTKSTKLLFLDMFPILKTSYPSDLYYDDVHLDRKGHLIYAEKISRIINNYDKYN